MVKRWGLKDKIIVTIVIAYYEEGNMKIEDSILYVINELKTNYIMERTMKDAGKDIIKGAVIGAGMGLLINLTQLKKNGLPKSMLKYVIR